MGIKISGPAKCLIAAVLLGPLAAGCDTTPNLRMVPPQISIPSQTELSAAVVVPEKVKSVTTVTKLKTPCITLDYQPVSYGELLEKTVRDRLSRLFSQVAVLRSPPSGGTYDMVYEATLTDVASRGGCGLSPDDYVVVTGEFREIDHGGREVWRSSITSARTNTILRAELDDSEGEAFSGAIGILVDDWIRDLLQHPKVAGLLRPGAASRQEARARRRAQAGRSTEFPTTPVDLTYPQGAPRPDDVAVIIANADYGERGKDIPDVVPAYADAEGFRRFALRTLGVRARNIIHLKDATGSQMAQVFGTRDNHRGQLFDWVREGRSRVYVYYAGHGAPAGREGAAYLVPSDADGSRIDLNGYPLDLLYNNLGKLPTDAVTVVLEACFSGASPGGGVISKASPVYLKSKEAAVPKNLTVVSAGAADQMASWEKDSSHGLFTKYYLIGMSGEADAKPYGDGDGTVALGELQAYLDDTLTYFARRYYGRDQNAQIVRGGGTGS